MTRHEMFTEIERLEMLIFLLNMKDKWTVEDFKYNKKWTEELEKLKKELDK